MNKTFLSLALLSLSGLAFSEAPAQTFSAELLLGKAKQSSKIENLDDFDDDDTSKGIRLAYQFNKYLAIEASYTDFGSVTDSESISYDYDWYGYGIIEETWTFSMEHEAKAIKLGIKGILPVTDNFSVIGRVGVAKWDYELTMKLAYLATYTDYYNSYYDDSYYDSDSASEKDNGTDVYYGLGLQYIFDNNIIVGLEYNLLEFDTSLSDLTVESEHEITDLTLSLGYAF